MRSWRSQADLDAILANPSFAPHMRECEELATYDAHVYEVVHIDNLATNFRSTGGEA